MGPKPGMRNLYESNALIARTEIGPELLEDITWIRCFVYFFAQICIGL